MKYLITLIVLFKLFTTSMAQGNLIPNSSFELNSGCPSAPNQLYLTNDWKNPTQGSPDYFHSCNSTWLGVPDNIIGSQNAHSGNAYPGFVVFGGAFTEYIQVQLNDSLQNGKTYCVEFFVSLAGLSEFKSIGPQAYFSTDSIRSNTTSNFSYAPQIISANIINDTTSWVIISGEFNAGGGEFYLTIGNFLDSISTPYDTLTNNTNLVSYFYIDDVSVYEKINSDAGNNKAICLGDSIIIGSFGENGITYRWNTATGLSDSTNSQPWAKPLQTMTYYLTITDTGGLYCTGSLTDSITITVNDCTPPSVFSVPSILSGAELLMISSLPINISLELYDERGRLVLKRENYLNDFSVINLASGIYVYRLHFNDGTEQRGKICGKK